MGVPAALLERETFAGWMGALHTALTQQEPPVRGGGLEGRGWAGDTEGELMGAAGRGREGWGGDASGPRLPSRIKAAPAFKTTPSAYPP